MRISLTAAYGDILHDDLIRLTKPVRKADPVQPSDAKLKAPTVVLACQDDEAARISSARTYSARVSERPERR